MVERSLSMREDGIVGVSLLVHFLGRRQLRAWLSDGGVHVLLPNFYPSSNQLDWEMKVSMEVGAKKIVVSQLKLSHREVRFSKHSAANRPLSVIPPSPNILWIYGFLVKLMKTENFYRGVYELYSKTPSCMVVENCRAARKIGKKNENIGPSATGVDPFHIHHCLCR
ncbi:hypothetical protein V6N11_032419 [Hibiscus sabdariffa]|uniref:Uncharacterized protein n=1 Tax=Hibiscus sabdariffa TaxID=183260 RepID=A0ABR2T0W4_9ROSI